jgi:hypothetical protein
MTDRRHKLNDDLVALVHIADRLERTIDRVLPENRLACECALISLQGALRDIVREIDKSCVEEGLHILK